MRTTLDIDDDVLETAREFAIRQKKSIGKIISEGFRQNLEPHGEDIVRNGIHVIRRQPGAKPVTMEMVNKLRDELGV